jgi:putative transcriptional regulator
MIKYTPANNLKPKVGDILLSEPFLNDPFFGRKAVLLCENNEGGSFGLVLNNYIDINAEDLLDGFPAMENRMSIGGPVNRTNLFYLHSCPEIKGSQFVIDEVYLGGDFEELKKLISDGLEPNKYRFFIGYSGWAEGQLDEEIKSRSWFVTAASSSQVMDTTEANDKFWKSLIKKMGEGYNHIASAPVDPSLN